MTTQDIATTGQPDVAKMSPQALVEMGLSANAHAREGATTPAERQRAIATAASDAASPAPGDLSKMGPHALLTMALEQGGAAQPPSQHPSPEQQRAEFIARRMGNVPIAYSDLLSSDPAQWEANAQAIEQQLKADVARVQKGESFIAQPASTAPQPLPRLSELRRTPSRFRPPVGAPL